MALSVQSIENLIDLVEIKLGAIEVYGETDTQDIEVLEATRLELKSQLANMIEGRKRFNVVNLDGQIIQAVPFAA